MATKTQNSLTFTTKRFYSAKADWSGRLRVTEPYSTYEAETLEKVEPTKDMTPEQVQACYIVVRYTVKTEADPYNDGKTRVRGLNDLACDALVVINADNADRVWETIKAVFPITEVPRQHFNLIERLLAVKGWSVFEGNFILEYGCEGWGFMGGTGCGTLIHNLRFNKVLGVLPELTGTRQHLATLWFHQMLGEVKAVREEHRHLRESVSEDDLFVTYNAHPICQATVRYERAYGYPVRGASAEHCSCTKCAAKLGIAANRKRNGIAITTPDAIEYQGFRLTYAETTKAGPRNQRTGRSQMVNCTGVRIEALNGAALLAPKALNADIKERGQRLAYGDDPRGVRGIYYVEALKAVTGIEDGKAVFVKTGERNKDAALATAKRLVDAQMLLAK